ncbi:MAG: hypothetical protein ACLQJR_16000 [Stellaceae bacterium]
MLLLTEDAVLVCAHINGHLRVDPCQDWVTIDQRRVLVEKDPEGRPIRGCPEVGAMKPCLHSLAVREGYSELIRVNGRRVCLDTISGLTDGTPPGIVKYMVREPGQPFVAELA